MNNILNTLLAEASSMNQQQNQFVPPSVGQAKQAVVAKASAKKIAAMSEPVPTAEQQYQTLAASSNGVADNVASQQMTDVRTLSPIGLSDKYGGSRASELLANFNQADGKLLQQQTMGRDWSQTAGDLVSGVGLGAVNSIGGIGALGLGMVNADAGQAAATKLEDFGNFVRDNQSPALQQRREILAATDRVSKSNSDLQYQRNKSEGQGIEADLARFGRGFMDGVGNALQDPITLSDGIAEGSGSFLALAPVSRAANAAKMLKAAAAKDAAITAGKTVEEAAAIAKGVMAKDGMAIPAAIGAMEAGGSYQGSVAEVSNMSHEQLLAGSPEYAEMIAAGVSPEEARTIVANKSGLMAAAITAPFAVAAGSLVKGFEGNALKMGAGKTAAMNMGKETVEEGSQGITGAIAQNLGIQTFADENKSLSENVGEQGGRGALYGLGTAGVMAAPSVVAGAVGGAVSSAGSAIGGVTNYLAERGDKLMAETEAAGPASINRVVEHADALVQTAPAVVAELQTKLAPAVDDTPEVAATKAILAADIPAFLQGLQLNEQSLASPKLQAALPIIGQEKTVIGAIRSLALHLKDEKVDDASFEKTIALMSLIESTETALGKLNGVDTDLLPGMGDFVSAITNAFGDVQNSPEIMAHYNATAKRLQTKEAQAVLNNPVQTPETAKIVLLAAQSAFDSIDIPVQISPEATGAVLDMAKSGKLVLTAPQQVSLQLAHDLAQAAKDYNAELVARGNITVKDVVTGQVTSDENDKRNVLGSRSGLQHMNSVIDLVKKGDMKSAAVALKILGNFAESQANKVAAINDQYKEGRAALPRTVQILKPDGLTFAESAKAYGITPDKINSVRFAHRVAAEAGFLAKIHNSLAQTYPALAAELKPVPELDVIFQGISADISAEFADKRRKYPEEASLKPPVVTPLPAAPVVKPKKVGKPKTDGVSDAFIKNINKIKSINTLEKHKTKYPPDSPKHSAISALIAERKKTSSTPEITSVTQTPEAIQAEQNQAAQAATSTSSTTATGTPAVTPASTSTKVVLPLTGKAATDAYRKKDQLKSDKANKFIGQGSVGSSTAAYVTAWGDKANTGIYTKDDIVFVSANGANPDRLDPNYTEIDKAIAAGATLITDKESDRSRGYNIGERQVAKYLSERSYTESASGTWTPVATSNQDAQVEVKKNSTFVPMDTTGVTEDVKFDTAAFIELWDAANEEDSDGKTVWDLYDEDNKKATAHIKAIKDSYSQLIKVIDLLLERGKNLSTDTLENYREDLDDVRDFADVTDVDPILTMYESLVNAYLPDPNQLNLPWETKAEYDARMAAVKAGIPPAQSAAVAASVQAPKHDLKAETILLNTLGKMLGVLNVRTVKALSDIKDIGNVRGGVYLGGTSQIGVDDALTGEARLGVLFHEFGHHVVFSKIAKALGLTVADVQNMSDTALLEEFRKLVPEIAAEYETWLANRKDSQVTDKNGKVRVPLLKSAMARFVYLALTGQDAAIKASPNRVSTFSEWIADNVGKALESNVRAQTVVEKFFKSIADAFKTMYTVLSGDKSLEAFMSAKSVEAWVETMLSGVKPAVAAAPVITPTVVPNAPSLTGQAIAAASVATPTAAPKTVTEAFPNLFVDTDAVTSLDKAFKLRKTPSRFFGSTASPLELLKTALSSPKALVDFLGTNETKRTVDGDIQEFYAVDLPALAEKLITKINENLANDLVAKQKSGDNLKTLMNKGGFPFQDKVRGKSLNIAEKDAAGNYTYNQKLLETAVLGSLHWFMNATNNGSVKEKKDIAAILGISTAEEVSDAMEEAFNNTDALIKLDMIPRMASAITEFWGMKANKDFSQSTTVGIPQAVASEILLAMNDIGVLSYELLALPDSTHTVDTFKLNHEVLGKGYEAYPTLLSEMANAELPETMYFDGAIPPVADTQMNSSDVSLTSDQKDFVAKEQNTVFTANTPVIDIYRLLGKKNLLNIFAKGELTAEKKKLYNDKHLETVEGQTISLIASFDSLMNRVKEMENISAATGKPLKDVAIRFAYNISKVGRLQMLGKQSPQASKMVREALMPNGSVIDLTREEDYNGYMLAVAQMLGVKVHKQSLEDSIAQAQALLDGPLAKAVKVFKDYHQSGNLASNATEVLQEAMTHVDGTFMGFHAIIDYAQTLTQEHDISKHSTKVYLEADGVTNGPSNAMVLLAAGKFTVSWLSNVAKGGLFFTPNKTMNQHRKTAEGANDMYMEVTDTLDTFKTALDAELARQGANGLVQPLAKMMSDFLPGVTFDETTGTVSYQRGVAKNPMTITIYGAGERGIANKIVGELMDAISERLSEALQIQAANPDTSLAVAMFGATASSVENATEKFKEFNQNMVWLSSFRLKEKDGVYEVKQHGSFDSNKNWVQTAPTFVTQKNLKSFKLNPKQADALQQNMLRMFVKPLRQSINAVVGEEVMDTAKLVQVTTQIQSIGLQIAFRVAVAEAIAKFKRPKTLFLSSNEQRQIMQELIKKFPTVKNGAQEFLVASTSQSAIYATAFSDSLKENLRMQASVFAPSDAGVAGAPYLNIGMGDGLMMQVMGLFKNAIEGTLKIFDGINMPVDKIKEGSLQANAAVAETWKGNPMRAVANSFRVAFPNVDKMFGADEIGVPYATEDETKALEALLKANDINNLGQLLAKIEGIADEVEARHLTMAHFAHSIDQMASAAAPHQNKGEVISNLTSEKQVERMNQVYEQMLKFVRTKTEANSSNRTDVATGALENVKIDAVLNDVAQIPLVTYDVEGLQRELPSMLKNSGNVDLIATALVALKSVGMQGYTIKVMPVGSLGKDAEGNDINGRANPNTKTIEIASQDAEVWVHELVHAATYLKVDHVLNGESESEETIAAVLRLKELMSQFEAMGKYQLTWTPEQVLSYRNAINSMSAALQKDGVAAQLNEFMAWATTNAQIIAMGKTVAAVPSVWVAMTKKVVMLIRRIFLGSSKATMPVDFFNAVRFNTAIVAMDKEPSVAKKLQDLALLHTTAYGNNERLNQIETAYVKMMAPLFKGIKNQAKQQTVNDYSTDLSLVISAAFPMSFQEKSTLQVVMAGLATEATINPGSMAKAQELYNYVTKNLTVESFMNNPALQDPVDRYYAEEKYNILMGKSILLKDALGRSSLMPAFLALATVDESFRNVLMKMDVPAGTKTLGTTLDVQLRNYGTNAMEALSNRIAGVSSTGSVRDAIDALQNNMTQHVSDKETILGMLSNKFGNSIDTANSYVVKQLGNVSEAGWEYGEKLQKSSNKYVNHAGSILAVLSGSLSDKRSGAMAEGMLSAMNSRNGLQPLRDFANDMLGRVGSNANIYDMIKQVRSTVAAVRQEFRENVPMKLGKTFKTKITDEVWNELNRAMGKTDMAALDMPFADIVELVRNKAQTAREIKTREDAIRTEAGNATVAATYLLKSKQLAKFMKTGVVGNNLYRNAPAIALKVGGVFAAPSPTMVKNIDELVTLYALRDMEQNERDAFNSLVQDEGLEFTFSYLKQQRVDETAKALQHDGSKLNHYKGYIPSVQSSGMSLIVADDTQDARLKAMSYVYVGDYTGAGAEGTVVKRGYYFNNAPTRGTFNQGIMQNVNITANGVSAAHGFTQGLTAGVITDPVYVAKLFKRINAGAEKGTNEHLMPIFDELGGVIAYERSIDPVQLERLQSNNKLHQMLGVWRGRQVEEAMAHEVNNKLVDNMVKMYEKDVKAGKSGEYVNIFDSKDKILADALKLMPADVRDYMLAATGNTDEFWVRRDMVFDAFGYRSASVGDAWTGNSRWTPETQKVFRKVALGVMGNQAFSRLLMTEKFVQGYMADARTTIVVKSVIVPALNLISNLGQLIARGVPLKDVLRKAPTKTAEIEAYVKNRLRQVDAEAELRAAKTTNETLKLKAEIQSLKDAQRRLTIWPLIEAGEFTAISDVGLTHDDIDLSQGRWHQYIEKKVDKLPEAVRNAGRYAYITKDTALFQGLQKAVQYGDFLAKAIMYDDMVLRQKKTPAEAMARITEEFVNYDRLPGRFRGYLEQMGMLWFYNFKLRSSKVAISMLRNNPVHALVSNFMPVPDVFGPVGSPLEDNFLAKAVSDTLGYSIGPGMGFRAPTMNPWWQMVN